MLRSHAIWCEEERNQLNISSPLKKDLVFESINYSVVKNRMSNDQRKGVITLVQKRIKTEQI